MSDNGTEIAAFHGVGSGGLRVTEDLGGCGYTFRITGRRNTFTIADHEAVALAETILERNQ
jgi:hypothetical protein